MTNWGQAQSEFDRKSGEAVYACPLFLVFSFIDLGGVLVLVQKVLLLARAKDIDRPATMKR